MRWRVITRAASWNLPASEDLIVKEEKRDPSDEGQRSARVARTSFNLPSVKKEAWERYINPETDKKMSYHLLAADFSGFAFRRIESLHGEYIEKYFDVVHTVFKTRTKQVAMSFGGNLFPWNPRDVTIVDRAEKLISTLTSDDAILIRSLREKVDDLKRAARCYALYEA